VKFSTEEQKPLENKQTNTRVFCLEDTNRNTKTIGEYPNFKIFNRRMGCCPIKCTHLSSQRENNALQGALNWTTVWPQQKP